MKENILTTFFGVERELTKMINWRISKGRNLKGH